MPIRALAAGGLIIGMLSCLPGEPATSGFYTALDDIPAAPAAIAPVSSFTQDCGRNEEGHRNTDNVITSPGTAGGAHHVHDYVGNLSTNAFSTNESLAAAATTCVTGDQSTYYWPVLRVHHSILPPIAVRISFHGNPFTEVVAVPRFLRVMTGDAKAATNGGRFERARWSCSGAPDRVTTRYPLCPHGQLVVRTLEFPSCWDGLRLDSPDHRDHVRFPAADGACPAKTFPIPRLEVKVSYAVAHGERYRLDSFPEQGGNPRTDHGDFIAVLPGQLQEKILAALGNRTDSPT
jgi:hypothetical protein